MLRFGPVVLCLGGGDPKSGFCLWPTALTGPFLCLPVPPSVLLDEIEAAELEGNDGRIEGVLCGAVKQLKATRAKPDSALYLSLMYLAKIKPNIFATEGVIEVRAVGGRGRAPAPSCPPAPLP